jgi:hypothetical protein
VVLLAYLALLAAPAQLRPAHFLPDDSYFYLVIARNIVSGQGSTFHGITETNGYHPLWMLWCVAADRIAGEDKTVLPRVVFAIQLCLTVGMVALFLRVTSRLGLRHGWIAVPVLAGYFLTGMYGSEAHLNGLCVAWALLLFVGLGSRRPPPARSGSTLPWVLLGVSLGLALLARLDNVFFCAALFVAAMALPKHPDAMPRALRVLLLLSSAGTVVIPYLAQNWFHYGHLVPISGSIKSALPEISIRISNLGTLGALVSIAGLVSITVGALPGTPPLLRATLLATGAGVLAHAVYIVTCTRPNIPWSWYYVPGVLLLSLLAAVAADRLSARQGRLPARRLLTVATILLALGGISRAWLRYRDPEAAGINRFTVRRETPRVRWQIALAEWMKVHLPPGSGVFVFDQPGALAYYSGLRVLPADGLVNDFTYDSEIQAVGIAAYLKRHRVHYYFGPLPSASGSGEVPVSSPWTRRPAGHLVLSSGSILVRVSDIAPAEGWPEMAIWSLAPP